MGLIQIGQINIDGTKIKANAANRLTRDNCQVAVTKNQLIVAVDDTTDANGRNILKTMVEETEEVLEESVKEVTADLRTLNKVKAKFKLMCIAHNFKKMHRLLAIST